MCVCMSMCYIYMNIYLFLKQPYKVETITLNFIAKIINAYKV